jgi:hypothetical protein
LQSQVLCEATSFDACSHPGLQNFLPPVTAHAQAG